MTQLGPLLGSSTMTPMSLTDLSPLSAQKRGRNTVTTNPHLTGFILQPSKKPLAKSRRPVSSTSQKLAEGFRRSRRPIDTMRSLLQNCPIQAQEHWNIVLSVAAARQRARLCLITAMRRAYRAHDSTRLCPRRTPQAYRMGVKNKCKERDKSASSLITACLLWIRLRDSLKSGKYSGMSKSGILSLYLMMASMFLSSAPTSAPAF